MEYEIKIYLDNGLTYSYDVRSEGEVKEDVRNIIKSGYKHKNDKHYPPERILKIESCRTSTRYKRKY